MKLDHSERLLAQLNELFDLTPCPVLEEPGEEGPDGYRNSKAMPRTLI